MDKETIKDFKAKIITDDMTIKDFVTENGFDYAMFNQAINHFRPVRQAYKEAINRFLGRKY